MRLLGTTSQQLPNTLERQASARQNDQQQTRTSAAPKAPVVDQVQLNENPVESDVTRPSTGNGVEVIINANGLYEARTNPTPELSPNASTLEDAETSATPEVGGGEVVLNSVDFPITAEQAAEEEVTSEQQEEKAGPDDARALSGRVLNDDEQKEVTELQSTDKEVRQHEQAHKSAAGQYAQGGPTYQYVTGPDGRRYAVAGEVQIDVSPEKDPQETIEKMQQVRRAALAPAEPSSQDRKVAATASRNEAKARAELQREKLNTEEEDVSETPSASDVKPKSQELAEQLSASPLKTDVLSRVVDSVGKALDLAG